MSFWFMKPGIYFWQMHLFDMDVPGEITFRESDTLSPGNQLMMFDTGKWFTSEDAGLYAILHPMRANSSLD